MQNRKTVLVTGGTKGIGKVIASHFLELDYNVAVCSRSKKSCELSKDYFSFYGKNAFLKQANVTDENDVHDLIDSIISRYKNIDILINNAGIYGPIGHFFDNDAYHWVETININTIGVFNLCRNVVPHMIRNNFGRIINISGGGATKPMPMYSAYSASKAAVVRFTETIALELEKYNITANAIAPGFIATDIHNETIEAEEKLAGVFYHQTQSKLSQGGDDPKHTAKLSEHLASDKCRITGRLISAIYDDWQNLYDSADIDNDLYTLRRVDDFFVKLVK